MDKNIKARYGFVGLGSMGGNGATIFHVNNYPVMVANTAQSDLDSLNLPDDCKYHILNGYGSSKDRKRAKQLLAENDCENFNLLINEIKERFKECKIIFLIASSGGGSGSGMLPAIAQRVLDETDKIICVITCIPDDSASLKEYINCYEFFHELESIDGRAATFVIDNNKNRNKFVLNEQFACYLDAFITSETNSTQGVVDRAEIENVLSQKGMCIINKYGSENATTQTVIERIRENIYAPLEDDGVVTNIALIQSSNKVRLNEVVDNVGKPLATFEGFGLDSTVLAISGLSLCYKRLDEIKQKIDENKETIKKNLTSINERRLTGSVDFLGEILSEQPKAEKKKSTRDMLFM